MLRNISKCLYEMCLKFEIMKCIKFSATMNSIEKAAICLLLVSSLEDEKRKRKNRKIWTRQWFLKREILAELRLKNAEGFRKYLRMNTASFEVLTLVLLKKNTLFYHVLSD